MLRPGNQSANLLSDADALIAQDENLQFYSPDEFSTGWSATGATISIDATKYIVPVVYSLKLQPTAPGGTIELSLPTFSVVDELTPESRISIQNSQTQFHARFYSDYDLNINVTLNNETESTSTTYNNVENGGFWSTAWSNLIDVGDNTTTEFSIDLEITNHRGAAFWMTLPHLVDDRAFYRNPFVYNSRKFLPTFMWDKDSTIHIEGTDAPYPSYPFFKLLHALTSVAGEAVTLTSRIGRIEERDNPPQSPFGTERYSRLVDADYLELETNGNWAAQLIGAPLVRSITATIQDAFVIGSASKGILSTSGYQYGLGPESFTEELIDDVDAFMRWQLNYAYFGRNAGTTQAVKESVKQILSGTKSVFVFPGGSSFTINIYTLTSETVGADYEGDSSDAVLKIATLAKPLGFEINHAVYDELPLILDSDVYARIGETGLLG